MSTLTQTINNQGDAGHRSPLWFRSSNNGFRSSNNGSRSAHVGVTKPLINLANPLANPLVNINGLKMRISLRVNIFGSQDPVP